MEKLKLNVQLYKYGYKNDLLVYEFDSVKELENWISKGKGKLLNSKKKKRSLVNL